MKNKFEIYYQKLATLEPNKFTVGTSCFDGDLSFWNQRFMASEATQDPNWVSYTWLNPWMNWRDHDRPVYNICMSSFSFF